MSCCASTTGRVQWMAFCCLQVSPEEEDSASVGKVMGTQQLRAGCGHGLYQCCVQKAERAVGQQRFPFLALQNSIERQERPQQSLAPRDWYRSGDWGVRALSLNSSCNCLQGTCGGLHLAQICSLLASVTTETDVATQTEKPPNMRPGFLHLLLPPALLALSTEPPGTGIAKADVHSTLYTWASKFVCMTAVWKSTKKSHFHT